MPTFFSRNEKQIAAIALLAVFLGLIRSLSEPFRLQHYSNEPLSFEHVQPFLIGSIVASAGLLVMVIFLFYGRHRIIPWLAVLTILVMMAVKFTFHI